MSSFASLFSADFLPQGNCYFWRTDIVWLNVGSDAAIALAYYSIPMALIHFARHRRGVAFPWIFWMFGAFILLCGTTHLIGIWTVWHADYGIEGLVKLITAGVSVVTAVLLWPLVTRALALPSPADLEAANRDLRRVHAELEQRVHERTAALEAANRALRHEVADREHAEARFRLAVEASPAGKLMIDAADRIVLVNRKAAAIFGYETEELIGQPVEMLVPARMREAHARYRASFLLSPNTRAMGAGRDLVGVRKDGSEVPVEIGLNPVETDEGVFVLSAIVDIQERKHAEDELREKSERLERTNRELDEFAHVVSHDLKAPLRGIASLAAWIRDDAAPALPASSSEHLGMLIQRVNRMSALIDAILQYSRIGRATPALEEVDVAATVRDVIDSLAPQAGIRVRIEGPLPAARYDRMQLAQVFQNLIENAIEHLGRPSGDVVVSGIDRVEVLEYAVRDDGVGIDARHHTRIFKIFQSLRPDGEGTGIGLAIVKKIVERHGGRVWVESDPGTGATFRFTVPKSPAPAQRGEQ